MPKKTKKTTARTLYLRLQPGLEDRLDRAIRILNETQIGKISINATINHALKEWLDRFEAEPEQD